MLAQQQQQQPKSGQLSGKYYRTRSLSQNLQQIFHPNRQSHSRSINNLSAIGATSPGAVKNQQPPMMARSTMTVPHSLPQSPRILVESTVPPLFPSLSYSPPSQVPQPTYPMFNFTQSPTKLKGFNLGEFRRNQYARSASDEITQLPNFFKKRPSWEGSDNRFQINDVLRENVELLRKYSDPKLGYSHDSVGASGGSSSLSFLQSSFKAKLASLFKNKKKYTIAEPTIFSGKETNDSFMSRCDSCQSLPSLTTKKRHKHIKKERKSVKQPKNRGLASDVGKLKSLNLNPPQMIGGSYDNLLILDRINQRKTMMGTYDTYHGRPLMSQSSRLKALLKYRKPSESDDATTLSFDYDSGDMSDSSSLQESSSDGENLSSFSDLTNKSSSRDFRMRSSTSVHSMPHFKASKKIRKSMTAAQSPNRSLETQQFPHLNFKQQQQPYIPSLFHKPTPSHHLTHQMSYPSPTLNNFAKQNFHPSLSMPSPVGAAAAAAVSNANTNQMIKAFFTSGPASSEDCPLVSFVAKPHKNSDQIGKIINNISLSVIRILLS